MELLLKLIGYFGLALTAFSSIWGTLHDATRVDEHGRKRLTTPGYVAIGLVILGLILNLASSLVGDKLEAERTEVRIAEERRRSMRLAQASQPLHSLQLTWRFVGVSRDQITKLEELQSDVDFRAENSEASVLDGEARREWLSQLVSAKMTYPWLAFLASGEWEERPDVVMRIPLNVAESVVLPVGALRLSKYKVSDLPLPTDRADSEEARQLLNVGAAVAVYEDADRNLALPPRSWEHRVHQPKAITTMELQGSSVEISTEIKAGDLSNALNKSDASAPVLSLMPEEILVFILTSDYLAWPYDNFSGPLQRILSLESSLGPSGAELFQSCALFLLPNGIEELTHEYSCDPIERGEFVDHPSGIYYTKYALIRLHLETKF